MQIGLKQSGRNTASSWNRLLPAFMCALLFYSSQAGAQSCRLNLFADGLQTHAANSSIVFGLNSKIVDNPNNILNTRTVTRSNTSTVLTCNTSNCVASGTPTAPHALMTFKLPVNGTNLTIASSGQGVLGDAGKRNYNTITVGIQGTLTVNAQGHTPGDHYLINQLTLGSRARLDLRPGNYWIKTLTVGTDALINVVGEGAVHIYIKDSFVSGLRSRINQNASGAALDPNRLVVVSYAGTTMGTEARMSAFVYAQGTAVLGTKSVLTGALAAGGITVGSEAVIYYRLPVASADFGQLCAGDMVVDADADGVPDNLDQCPNTPIPEAADANGCSASQRDADHDTVTDNLDLCPNTPEGEAANSFGCSPSQLDTDEDGVTDNLDQCPATPGGEPADANGCSASQRDTDGDGVTDNLDQCPNTPLGSAVGTDGCRDFERDTDHDGIPDLQDAFPNDPARSRLPAVQNLTAVLQATEERILVSWQAPQNPENVHAYHVYRAEGTAGELQRISAQPVASLSFVDVDIANGRLYRYRVVALTMAGLEGEPGALVSVMAAFNNAVVQGLSAQRQPINVRLQWQAISGQQYRIYRAPDAPAANFTPLLDVTANEYLDTGVVWNQGYQYRVAGLLNIMHPETGAVLTVEGPPSAPVTAAALAPLSVNIFDVVVAADGVLEKLLTTQAEVTVSGSYANAIGPVQITATANGSSVTVAGENGSFRLTLPAMPATTLWNLSFAENTVADRGKSVMLRVLLDATPPVIVLNNPAQAGVNSDTVTITGTVTDNSGSVASINVVSDRFPGTPFGLIIEGANTFSAEVPLLFGANTLTVTARDPTGNVGQASITVNRTIGVVPIVEILSPVNGAIVQTDRVNVSGRLYTSLTPDKIRILMGEQILFPEAGATPGIYNFAFNNIALQPGVNNLSVRAETTAGNASAVVAVIYQDEATPVGQQQAPVIQITNPNLNSYTRNDSIVIAGFVAVATAPASLRINNTPVDLVGQSPLQGYFQYPADLSGAEGVREFNLVATDGANRTTSRTLSITRDTGLPVITLNDASLQLAPAVNTVTAVPFSLKGQVQDAHLGGFSINGNTVTLHATTDTTTFEFDAALDLPLHANSTAILQAWDRAGNSRTQELILNADPQTTVEVISPRAGETLRLSAPASVAVVARLSIVEPGYTVSARIDQGAAVTMTADGNAMTANVPLDLALSSHTLTITVSEQNNPQVASASISFNTEDLANIPLALERSEPANNATGIEPNESINLYFNKPIDPALLQIEVRETVNGLTFNIERSENPDFFPSLENAEPIEVHRNQELVPGESGMLTGNTVAVFYPSRDFAYYADLYVTVRYAGQEFERFTFKVREIPTFLQGMVLDPASQPIGGLTVSLPGLGLEAVTSSNGSYAFGFGLPERALPAGRHEIVFNPGRADPAFAEIRQWVSVQKGQLNRNGGMVVPFLSADIPFRPISSRQATAILAEGDLVLDLSLADLRFPNGRTSGDMHVQFAAAGQYSHATLPGIEPQWVFAVQPPGIAVTGKVGVTLELPALNGSFSYLPVTPIFVVMLGFDQTSKQIVPVGVGRLENQKVTATLTQLRALDYLGYVIVPTDQKILEDYANGVISLQALIQAVTSGAVNNE
jgi:fibronectin type 3 domain-containing protein